MRAATVGERGGTKCGIVHPLTVAPRRMPCFRFATSDLAQAGRSGTAVCSGRVKSYAGVSTFAPAYGRKTRMNRPLVIAAALAAFAFSLAVAANATRGDDRPIANDRQTTDFRPDDKAKRDANADAAHESSEPKSDAETPDARGDEKSGREAPDANAEPTPAQAAKEAAAVLKVRLAATRPSPHTRPAARPGTRPMAGIDRVLIVSIDGLRPDLLLLAEAPMARELMRRGSYSMWAMTTPQSITLPSHVSMLSGVTPNRHGILWNSDLPLEYPLYPSVPTLFEVAKRRGYTTALVAGKDKFDVFDRPGVLDWRWIPRRGTVKTADVIRPAVRILTEHKPQVMLVHLPSVDVVGHSKGWASPQQMRAIEEADDALSQLVYALEDAGTADATLLIVSADHGGQGRGHAAEDARSRHIPWIAVGPGVRQGVDLTSDARLVIRTEDTFATACWALGIPPSMGDLDGKPVKQIRGSRDDELLKTMPSTTTTAPTKW